MQEYIKTYLDYFEYGEQDYIPSELTRSPAADIHHIVFRSQGGKDNIENLIALTREEHDRAQCRELSAEYLQKKHNEFIKKWKEKKLLQSIL